MNHVTRPLGLMLSTLVLAACTSPSAPARESLEAQAPSVAPAPEAKAPEAKTPEAKTPEATAPEAAALVATPTAEPAKGQVAKAWVQGVDVSRYQPTVKWNELKGKAAFVFVKATETTGEVDPRFKTHWSGAKKAGLPRGAYHFFHPKEDVDKQVANFTRHLKPDPGELPPVVDVEEFKKEYDGFTCAQLAEKLQHFSQGVEKELGRKPMIYTNHVTWSTNFCDHPYFVDHPLWLAAYTNQAEPRLPKGWTRWQFWQFTEKGQVEGIDGQVDQSYFNGNAEELKGLFAMAKAN
ncbi:glycoside hydrolase family 25 protein [Pyxidicoccus sp. MSG2]|uniref:glycoside hydrolase family 25 protein n=1 Tax=Pyxidicoccus sp. MSG2 TaxID=2996790 RepID=UPI0022712069|nr:GH25 family lysozyme [Pyxidicoccus sp. MSG2]MCY1021143.1 GH25 family lysozyme [Pyxidicoccus sp. MSG2]